MSDDDDHDVNGDEDPRCPTIHVSDVTKEQKQRFRKPWKDALIIEMFEKGVGYLRLQCSLKSKWKLRGDFSLIDIGCNYYIMRFTNKEDYTYVLTQGPCS